MRSMTLRKEIFMNKYKVLLTGTNQVLIGEFFNHMEFTLECMGCTERFADIQTHLKYFEPDVMILCLAREDAQTLSAFRAVVQRLSAADVPLIIVGDDEDCDLFGRTLPMAADMTVRRPFTTKGLEERVVGFLKDKENEKEKQRKRIAKLEKEAGVASKPVPKMTEKAEKDVEDALAFIDKIAEEEKEEEYKTEVVIKGAKETKKAAPADAKNEAASQAEGQAEEEKRKHILIVDDDSTVLKLVKRYLGKTYNVATAINGKVALKFLEKKDTDLILLDYEMPGENGAQVLQKLRSNEKTKDLPVVFLTGVQEKDRIREVLELNPQSYLLKPMNMERLSSTLKSILGE